MTRSSLKRKLEASRSHGFPVLILRGIGFLAIPAALWGLLSVPAVAAAGAGDGIPAEGDGKKGLPEVGLRLGNLAPDFIARDFRGEEVKLSDHRGKVVLLDFWASWCGPCLMEMPNITRIKNKYPGDKFVIIGVSLDTARTLPKMKELVKKHDLDYPIPYDGKGWANEISRMYRVRGIPATYVLDHRGVIVARNMRGASLEQLLDSLLLPKK